MINTQLLSKTLSSALFAAAIIFGSSAMAQVKIGTNPTVIEGTSNLEVEGSTAGRKMKVDKSTGQVTIADGTQGVGKILTSDASGGASWQFATAQSTDVWVYAKQTVEGSIPNGITILRFNSEIYDRGNNYDPGTGRITVPTTGIYQISSGLKKSNVSANNGGSNLYLAVFVNGVIHTAGYEASFNGGDLPRASLAVTLQVNAGDIVDVRIQSNFATYNIIDGYLTFVKLSN